MEEGCLVTRLERCDTWRILLSLILPYGFKPQFMECSEALRLQINDKWKMKLSLLFMKLARHVSVPLAIVGDYIEFFLNLLAINGGMIRTIWKHLTGTIAIPRRGSDSFLSFVGLVERRSDLYNGGIRSYLNGDGHSYLNGDLSLYGSPMDPGNRFFADVAVMASTVAYENELVIKKRVDEHWEMHFVEFFNFWNDYLEKKSTQAFIFCDKKIDANLVVISFRGTQVFEADDYITDLDLSWYKYSKMGRVHLGFLEALGLANRSNMEKTTNINSYDLPPDSDKYNDPEKPLAYYVLREKLKELLQLHKNAKFIVTGHSLGGALAVLFSAVLFMHEEEKLLDKLLAVYTFGQPRVGDKEFADFMNRNLNQPVARYFRLVYSNDIIPRLPFDDDIFMYKHFGVCLYYNSRYIEKILEEEPNRNFSLIFSIPIRVTAVWELVQSLVLWHIKGKEFKETKLSTLCRIIGVLLPGISGHNPVNYINAVRLGPPNLNPSLSRKKE